MFKSKTKNKKLFYIVITVVVAVFLIILNALVIEPNRFVVTQHQLNQINTNTKTNTKGSIKVIQISDLHLKKFNARAKEIAQRVNELQPNLILFTGDSIDKAEQLDGFNKFLSILDQKTAKYAILGNWEYWANIDIERLKKVYSTYNCRLLINESVVYKYGDKSLLITGLDDLVSEPDLVKSLENVTPNPNHILLAHSPAYRDSFNKQELEKIDQYKPEYMLSGHTHGGQLSFFGFAPLRPSGSGRYTSGWYRDGRISLYVSRGLGVSVLPVRMGAVPEISYFEWFLKKT